ncbi:uncharacterized protein LOC135805948 isoform X2 [Sycon ciliatum]|uniref:uncharacterized protein LOC135805948 isoform X2 n=1 Tax=Sycon ciliatum TaxID=27933 RepID=UPI0031F68E0D
MKSRTVTTMIMMMVVLLVVPLLNVEGHDSITAYTPKAINATSVSPTNVTSVSPTTQSQLPTTPATMNATATRASTQATGPAEVVSTSGTTSTKDATALSIDGHHYGISVAALVISVGDLAVHLVQAIMYFCPWIRNKFSRDDGLNAASMEMS